MFMPCAIHTKLAVLLKFKNEMFGITFYDRGKRGGVFKVFSPFFEDLKLSHLWSNSYPNSTWY